MRIASSVAKVVLGIRIALIGACTMAVVLGQSEPASRESPAKTEPPARVAVLGASLSAGFVCPFQDPDAPPNRTVRLDAALVPIWDSQRAEVRDFSDVATFLDPLARQRPKVERALEFVPDLMIGIDFLFWFGYGHVTPDTQEGRLELLEQGLSLLDRFECPVLVGDFPDMTGADPRMLAKAQIPDASERAALNRRLHEFAAERDHIHVFPLAAWTAEMKSTGRAIEVGGERLLLGPAALLQSDKLHPTSLGVAVVGQGIASILAEVLPDGHRLRLAEDVVPSMIEFAEAARADLDLEEAIEAAASPAGANGRK